MEVSKIQIVSDMITNIIMREDHTELKDLQAMLKSRDSDIELYFLSTKKDVGEEFKEYYQND